MSEKTNEGTTEPAKEQTKERTKERMQALLSRDPKVQPSLKDYGQSQSQSLALYKPKAYQVILLGHHRTLS